MQTMRANVIRGVDRIGIEEVPRPHAGVGEAVIHIGKRSDGVLKVAIEP